MVSRIGKLNGAGEPMGTQSVDGRCHMATTRRRHEVVPGHVVTVPVGAGQTGGARGWLQRWKVSMMIMRPPQHGHGGG